MLTLLLLGQALGPLIRRRIECVGFLPGRFFVAGDGFEVSRFAGYLRRQVEDFFVGVDSVGGGGVFQPLSRSLPGPLENSGQYPHVEAEESCSTRKSQNHLPRAVEGMTHP